MNLITRTVLSIGCIFLSQSVFSQSAKYKEEIHHENGFTYSTVTNDPLNARIYTLANGLKVYLSVYKDAPRIQTYIAVKAGSKNDPAENTGLAHYLEHILFKGTSKIGTSDWSHEKAELDKIESLYEVYRKTTNENIRTDLYHQIDSISLVAASYSIANEYDKLLSSIGAAGTNAYTFVEQTVYVNDIPSNQIEKWAEIEGERFHEFVPRLFHTELEAVYEEKNRGLDSDQKKVWEEMLAAIFQKHPYGTQTTIGTVSHLKNPSITAIKKYFASYYVPNNMAICLSGDLDPNKTIQAINKYFGAYKSQAVPEFKAPIENPITKPILRTVQGPDAESLSLSFRFPGNKSNASLMLELLSMVLTNGQAGLMDLNLNQKQQVLTSYSYPLRFNDYSVLILGGKPRKGQSLDSLKYLLLSQLDLVKKGKFEDWLLKAIVNDYKISKMRQYESNKARADAMVDAFTSNRNWAEAISETDKMAEISRKQLIEFCKLNLNANYVEVRKETGPDTTLVKVIKPKISAVALNRDKQSEFLKFVTAQPSESLQPVFLDYAKDITQYDLKKGLQVLYKQNNENEIFTLNFVVDIGRDFNPKYALAVDYLDYLGTKKFNAEALKKEFYKLGCTYGVSATADAMYITLSGLNESFKPALLLLEDLLKDPVPDKQALKDMVDGILKIRTDNKLSKDIILRTAMLNYAKYGKDNPFTNILSQEQLQTLKSEELIQLVKELTTFEHRVLYYGPLSQESLTGILNEEHKTTLNLKEVPPRKKFVFQNTDENLVYFVNYNMVQAEVIFMSKSVPFNKTLLPAQALFNEYFGGGMGSLVFQEMRESKALAYAVNSRYQSASRKEDPNYISSYIGTQADKIKEAIEGMQDLIDNMPQSDNLFVNAKDALIESINTQRITKSAILSNFESAKKLGLETDVRAEIYEGVKNMNFEDIRKFQQEYIKGQKKTILVIGSKEKVDFKSLEKYGKIKELNLEEIFGY